MVCNQLLRNYVIEDMLGRPKNKSYAQLQIGGFRNIESSIRTRESGLVLLIFEAESFVKLTFNITNTKLVLGLRYLVKPSNFTSVGVVIDDES